MYVFMKRGIIYAQFLTIHTKAHWVLMMAEVCF